MVDKNKLMGKIVGMGFTQKSLASQIGVSKNTLCSKINGSKSFNTDEIDVICDTLGIYSDREKAEIFLAKPSQNKDERREA